MSISPDRATKTTGERHRKACFKPIFGRDVQRGSAIALQERRYQEQRLLS
jgi:hypothetical protein